MPPLGSGLGGLDWAEGRPLIEAALGDLDVHAIVFEPHATGEPQRVKRARVLIPAS